MLRSLVVISFIVVGGLLSLKGPFPALLFYLWIAYFRPESWVWGDWALSLQLSLFVGIYLVGRALFASRELKWDWRASLLLLFVAHNGLSLALSTYSADLVDPYINFAKSIVIAYLISCLASDASRFRQVILVMALSLGAEGAKQGWFGLLFSPGARNDNGVPFLGDNNAVAVGMLMLVPLLLVLSRTATSRWERYSHRIVAIGVVYRALSTYSRGGFLSCAALAAMYIIRSKHRVVAITAVVVICGVLAPALPDAFWARMDTTFASEGERDRSTAGRLYFWNVGVAMAREHPFVGVGPSGYNYAFNEFDYSNGEYGENRSVHSIWFGVLAELGFTGLVLFVALMGTSLWTTRRVRLLVKQGNAPPELAQFAFAVEAGIIIFCIGGTFLPIQYNEMAWHFVGLSIALHRLAALPLQAEESAVSPSPARPEPRRIPTINLPRHLPPRTVSPVAAVEAKLSRADSTSLARPFLARRHNEQSARRG